MGFAPMTKASTPHRPVLSSWLRMSGGIGRLQQLLASRNDADHLALVLWSVLPPRAVPACPGRSGPG